MSNVQLQPCIACSGETKFWGTRVGYEYYRCTQCGTLQLTPAPSPEHLAELYASHFFEDNHINAEEAAEIHRPIYRKVIQILRDRSVDQQNFSVLDYGCGWGGLVDEMKTQGIACMGIDLSDAQIKSCQDRGLNCRTADLPDLSSEGLRFDGIVGIFVFEHLADHKTFFSSCDSLLKENGVVVIGIPTAPLVAKLGVLYRAVFPKREMPTFGETIKPPWHVGIFSYKGVQSIAQRNGFRVVKVVVCPKYPSPSKLRNVVKRCLEFVERSGLALFGPKWPVSVGSLFVLERSFYAQGMR